MAVSQAVTGRGDNWEVVKVLARAWKGEGAGTAEALVKGVVVLGTAETAMAAM